VLTSLRGLFATAGSNAQRRLSLEVLAVVLTAVTLYMVWMGETQFAHSYQIYFGWGVFIALVLIHISGFASRYPLLRVGFVVLAIFITFRYLWWRSTQTLLWTGPLDFIGMALVYLAELYAIVIHVIGLFSTVWPTTRQPVALPADPALLPVVDVFIPTYNEPDHIVELTLQAATHIDYPRDKLRIHILDDGGTVARRRNPATAEGAWKRRYTLMRMAQRLGASYHTRENNVQAKAGNINHALTKTDGDLILVLDCDHVPTRDILQNTVGYFIADEKMFLVQTPHFFINPAPVEKNLAGFARIADESDMFYGAIMPGLDAWNASYFCGSAAVLRRSCLLEIGGLSGNTITEDVETAISLHARGYHSVYLRRPMICGLAPESYDDFAIQRTRWAQGSTQVLMTNNPLTTRGLTFAQRLCYLNSALFWFFGVPRLIYYVAPAVFLVGGLYIYHVSFEQVMAYSIPYVLSTFPVMALVYQRTRRPFFSEIYESVQSVFVIPAVLSVLANPAHPSFKVTPKGQITASEMLSPLSVTFLAIIVLNVAALTAGGFRWIESPEHRAVIGITMAWCSYNLYLGLMSMGAFWERRQIRRHHRIPVGAPAQIEFTRLGKTLPATLIDMSLTGMGASVQPDFQIKDREDITVHAADSTGRAYRFDGSVLHAFRRGQTILCGIELTAANQDFSRTVDFLYGDSARWQRAWDARFDNSGTLRLVGILLKLGVRAVILSFPALIKAVLNLPVTMFRFTVRQYQKARAPT